MAKFGSPDNPYYKMPPKVYVADQLADFQKEMEAEDWECEGAPYGVTKQTDIIIEVAGGGPSMWYTLTYDSDNNLIGGKWNYAWWGDPEEISLSVDEAEVIQNYFGVSAENF